MTINQKINAKGNAVGMYAHGLINPEYLMKRVIRRANRGITFYDLHTPQMLLPRVWKTNEYDINH